ncbi:MULTISPECIES: M20 family metallopeptidase [Brevibacterium]|uniref:M20 family metallopeptidase n=1 Tax=Brevibacterium TaxID=1696 RepID=UPI00227DEE09|nr:MULTISPECIES: M20 family metallopeptidase [Brevibacterium]WAL39626.1 M20 family metallopeptidase [Brevibacterium sp. BRM-1]
MTGPSAAPGAPITAAEARVLERIDPAALTALTVQFVNAGGENPPGDEQGSVDALTIAAAAAGLASKTEEVAPGRPNLTVDLPGGKGPGLMFLGHSDVVPAGTGWTGDPFAATVAGGRITGRGACDMKGGLAAVLAAMSALREEGVALSGPVSLVCTVDEEDLDLGIRAYVAQESALPAGRRRRWAGCVVAEPTNLETVIACRGDAYFRIRVRGVPAHSGRPEDGRNAIDAAARIVDLIRADHAALAAAPEDLIGAGTWNVGTIEGGQATTTVPAHCNLTADRRLLPGEDPEAIRVELVRRIEAAGITGDGIAVEVEEAMFMPGFRTAADHPLTAAAGAALRAVGREPRLSGWTAACDGGFIDRDLGVPTVVLGPGDLNAQAHQVDERVEVDDLLAAARAYALLALRTLA